jgi:hypothetical protein
MTEEEAEKKVTVLVTGFGVCDGKPWNFKANFS